MIVKSILSGLALAERRQESQVRMGGSGFAGFRVHTERPTPMHLQAPAQRLEQEALGILVGLKG